MNSLDYYEALASRVDYNPNTGFFTWRQSRGGKSRGSSAGSIMVREYITISCTLNGVTKGIKGHRLAWYISFGYVPECIDHIDGNTLDNRLCNLRECTQAENSRNISKRVDNKTGVTGVNWRKQSNKWTAQIQYSKKKLNLGSFENFDDAVKARKEAEEKYFGEFKPRN